MKLQHRAEVTVALWSMVVTAVLVGCASPPHDVTPAALPAPWQQVPDQNFTHAAEKPHAETELFFHFDQLDHHYRVPGEFTHRLNGDRYGFDALSFIVTETHPAGGPGLHVHDVEEAHVLLEGTARYRIGDQTLTVEAPYIARVPAGMPHTFINAGRTPFKLIAVFPSKHPGTTRIGPNPLVQGTHETDAAPLP